MNTKLFFASIFLVLQGFNQGKQIPKIPNFKSWKLMYSKSAEFMLGRMEIDSHSYPSQAALVIFKENGTYFCGGSLISNRWVLTAAHCINMKPDYIQITLGAYHLSNTSSMVVVVSNEYILHEDWDEKTLQNDIALVRLPTDIVFTEFIKSVELADGGTNYVNKLSTSISWGTTVRKSQSSTLVKILSIIISNEECADSSWSYKELITPKHICTSGEGLERNCRGDSGGPLLVEGRQVGVESFGTQNCWKGNPLVYTRVADYTGWISERISRVDTRRDTTIWEIVAILAGIFMFMMLMMMKVKPNYLILKAYYTKIRQNVEDYV